jgi:hypothetical protein
MEQETTFVPIEGTVAKIWDDGPNTIIAEIPDSSLPKAVIFRDSFMDAMLPLVSEQFSKTIYRHSFAIDLDFIAREQPDIVVYEVAQRYLDMLLADWDNLIAAGE